MSKAPLLLNSQRPPVLKSVTEGMFSLRRSAFLSFIPSSGGYVHSYRVFGLLEGLRGSSEWDSSRRELGVWPGK